MICVDTSAVVAIVRGEPERTQFMSAIEGADRSSISAANYLESSLVCEGGDKAPGKILFESEFALLARLGLTIVAFDETQAELAREGFRRYGKGRHPAGLNFGDCFAYALAKALDAPLLYKGSDFDKTDLRRT